MYRVCKLNNVKCIIRIEQAAMLSDILDEDDHEDVESFLNQYEKINMSDSQAIDISLENDCFFNKTLKQEKLAELMDNN